MVTSFPPACPTCRGSRKVIELTKNIDSLSGYRTLIGVGFTRSKCPKCGGLGTLRPEEVPGSYPPPPRSTEKARIESPEADSELTKLNLSPDQNAALEAILDWFFHSKKKCLSLAGFAGTGKTTIIAELLRRLVGWNVRVCAPTGKAAVVLRHKGVPATTLHKLVYAPESNCTHCLKTVKPLPGKPPRCPRCGSASIKIRWVRVPIIDAGLVIVDEASMLNLLTVNDVEMLASRILYVGDHGQLEPIGGDPGIMRNPDIRLEVIHRQAEGSGQLQLAHHVRRGRTPQSWDGSAYADARVLGISKLVPQMLNRYDVILCGYNKTRKDVNAAIREYRGFRSPLPQVGERIICLQNDSDLGLYNGLLVTVQREYVSHELPRYDLIDDVGNEYFDIQVDPEQFRQEKKIEYAPKGIGLFDFGSCLTVHKAQGSEWDSVGVIEQIARSWNPSRWRYTAITRASKRMDYWLPTGRL